MYSTKKSSFIITGIHFNILICIIILQYYCIFVQMKTALVSIKFMGNIFNNIQRLYHSFER